ncbi:hypothetical protein EA114_23695 [Salmonella enterica subsp. enterica serovar 6,7:b:-]|nr:hypothetical protein [Salmonella enterica subsp. enterica serovar 6,7:b:-]EBH8946475.1 hypothetical protein [Salmonella enterica subsp. enterica serovar 6,7:b:-]ECH8371637.1 hypothetical protein [Salmonella enterica subsp. enterica]MMQ69251.1 hypothetical protein [Salmonella enterica subsp. enterica serovar 6,7:b:-]
MLSLSANEKTIRVKVACVNFHVFPPETQKPRGVIRRAEYSCWPKRLNGFPALELMLDENSANLNIFFL